MFGRIYKNKKVLITGNTGFKGSWLTIWLLKLGARVYGISKDIPTEPSMFKELGLKKKVVHYKKDVKDLDSVIRIIKEVKPSFLFHLAAQSLVSVSYSDPIETIFTNVLGTTNVLEALRKSNHNCVGVIITSDKCYDNVEWAWGYKETDTLGGKDIYSGSKGAAEYIFNSYYHSFFKNDDSNVKVVSTRAGNVIGGGDWAKDRIVPDCMRAWSKNEIVEIRSPKATRPWQHVLEPLSGYLTLGQQLYESDDLNGESFNFGPLSQYGHTVEELIQDLSRYWNFQNLAKAYKVTGDIKFHEAGLLKLNCDKALFHLKWLPTLDYEKLIEFTGSWYFNFYNGQGNMLDSTLSQIEEYEHKATEKEIPWTK
ncbi:MAG: CDP-glucose 4,6-dehydratase [Candidatus Marinimicrobia bacterium]|nr:CDP-glucose 4,6-dehydratase [Candidatus Neomarinimicrobiota bacterium]